MSHDVPRKGESEVLVALAAGRTVTDAADAGGVSRRTVHRWLEDDAFRAEVRRLREELLGHVVGALIDGSVEAVATLRAALHDESPQIRVRAALGFLSTLVIVRESVDLEARLRALEQTDLYEKGLK